MELYYGNDLLRRNRRIGNPKARSGCFVCKGRRVKCDERKPGCKRCEGYGVKCPGYPVPKDRTPSTTTRLLLPAEENKERPSTRLSTYQPSSVLPGETAIEHQYFSYFTSFCEEDKSRVSGPFAGSVWTKLMLQASRDYEFTRHGLIALGAINKSIEEENAALLKQQGSSTGTESLQQNTDSHVTRTQHRAFALREYQKAIKAMINAPIETSYSHNVRRALMSSLVIIHFEKYLRNDKAVLRQMVTALALLEEWFAQNPLSHPGISTPVPETVEEELVALFRRFDLQVMHFQDPRLRISHQFRAAYESSILKNIPMKFRDLEAARQIWDILACRVAHFMIGAGQAHDAKPLSRVSQGEDSAQWTTLSALYIYGSPIVYSQAARNEAAIHLREIQDWLSAFEPLYRSSQSSPDSDESFLSFQMITNAMIWAPIANAVLFTKETEFDVYLPTFQKLLSMIQSRQSGSTNVANLLENVNIRGYQIDLGGTVPIFFLGLKCRDRTIRNYVEKILEWMSQNFKWSAMTAPPMLRVLLEVYIWIRGIEEDDIGPLDEIPEGKRVTLTRFERHKVTNVVMAQCIQRYPGKEPVWYDKKFKIAGFGE